MGEVTIDFIVEEDSSCWSLVLVEEGPWEETEGNLHRLQERLYDCLDAALDGQVAMRFPDSKGKAIQITLNGYNLPEDKVRDFFSRFSGEVLDLPDYQKALESNAFVSSVSFAIELTDLPDGG